MKADRVEDALAALAQGSMVVAVDDEDRENEGDLIPRLSAARRRGGRAEPPGPYGSGGGPDAVGDARKAEKAMGAAAGGPSK
jgi:hypothetical protein